MTVLWVSRHRPLPAQIRDLKRLFGEGTVVNEDPDPFSGAADIVARFRAIDGPSELVLVAPMTVVKQVLKRGVQPLYAMMEEHCGEFDRDRDVWFRGRTVRFHGFRRITSIDVNMEEIR